MQLLAAVDLNDPTVQNTMLAMLPLPEDAAAAAADEAEQQEEEGAALENAIWPVGQVSRLLLVCGKSFLEQQTACGCHKLGRSAPFHSVLCIATAWAACLPCRACWVGH